MKPAAFFLLLSGALLAVAAVVLLPGVAERLAFVVAALLVELGGLALAVRAHMAEALESRREPQSRRGQGSPGEPQGRGESDARYSEVRR